jgi:hypothetical protein
MIPRPGHPAESEHTKKTADLSWGGLGSDVTFSEWRTSHFRRNALPR